MISKQNNLGLNCQEDEDGFILNPYDNTYGNKDSGKTSNTRIVETGSLNFTMISSKQKRKSNNEAASQNHQINYQ